MHFAMSLSFGVGFFMAVLNGLNDKTALNIFEEIEDLVLISIARQFRVAVIKSGSL